MEYKIKKDKLEDFHEIIADLEHLLTERISELHKVEGGMQARHAYIFYRKLLWEAKNLMRDSLKEIK